MSDFYLKNGYTVFRDFFSPKTIRQLTTILMDFHQQWIADNYDFYNHNGINSAYITGTKYLDDLKRQALFELIGSNEIMNIAKTIFAKEPMFMNTQLFFDPVNEQQLNYWHRDPQYHLTLKEQQIALDGPQVVHFRIPLIDERGIELIPGTHKRWDSDEELDVRLAENGRKNSDDLSSGSTIALASGDLLVFSANMIHRGLYGGERLAFDILLCDVELELAKHIKHDCLPSETLLKDVKNQSVFLNTLDLKN